MIKSILKVLILILIISSTSCVSKKEILYFQNDVTGSKQQKQEFTLIYKQNDLLAINVSALDIEAIKPFNLPIVSYNALSNAVNGTPRQQNYLIDAKGEINFPVLGKIELAGLTRSESIHVITTKLKPYVKGASVNIHILNFRINVLGDVKSPGTFLIENERVTILDALAMAGDLNISGERTIEIKRETASGIESGFIDLKSNNMFSSPFYYLQQNDVVYISPNKAKSQSASYNQNTGVIISVASILISLIAVLTR